MSRRLFFGLKPDETVRNEIDSAYRRRPDFNGRPHHPEDLHMTLLFLGQVDGTLDCIREAAAGIQVPKFTIALDRIKYWPKPGVLLLHPSSPPELLSDLVVQLSTTMGGCGFEPEARPFKPHVTLARKAKTMADAKLKKSIDWHVGSFSLYVSSSRQTPPFYQVINQWPLLSTDS